MSRTLNGFNPKMIVALVGSGAASNATFALTGITTNDIVIAALRCEGVYGGITAALAVDGTDFTVTADGVCQTILTDTSANRLVVLIADVSAGSES